MRLSSVAIDVMGVSGRDMSVAAGILCLQTVSMPNVLVRDLPDDVHAALQRRAEERGQSLQQYLAGELRRLAAQPSVEDVLDRIGRRRGGRVGLAQAAADLAEERASR
jgi:antitoxin FitA